MKKIIMMCVTVLGLTACGATSNTPVGNAYTLTTPAAPMPITLNFSAKDNRFYGQAVNTYFGTYTVDGQTLTLSPTGSTMMMGPRDEMAAERQFLDTLPKVTGYTQSGKTLTLTVTDGEPLTLTQTGTAAD